MMSVLDILYFIEFYFEVNEVILTSILTSIAGYFAEMIELGALAKKELTIMAILANYSSPFVNMVGALFVNALFNTFKGSTKFHLYHFKHSFDE